MKSWLPWSHAALIVGLCFAGPAGLWAAEEEATPVFDWIKPDKEAKQVPPAAAPKTLPPYQNPFAGDADLGPLFVHGAPPVYRPVRKLEGHTDRVVAVAISADGKIGVTCAANGDCWSWDLTTGKKLAAYEKTLPGRKFIASLTSDGKYASIGCEQEGVFSFETATGKLAKLHKDELNILCVDHTPDGKWVLFSSPKTPAARFPTTGGFGAHAQLPEKLPLDLAAWSPDGKLCLLAKRDTDRFECVFLPNDDKEKLAAHAVASKDKKVRSLAAQPYVGFSGAQDGALNWCRYSPEQGFLLDTSVTQQFDFSIEQMSWVGDGKILALVSPTGRIRFVDGVTGDARLEAKISLKFQEPLFLAPGGQALVGHDDGTVSCYQGPDISTHSLVRFPRKIAALRDAKDYEGLERLARRLKHDSQLHGLLEYDTLCGVLYDTLPRLRPLGPPVDIAAQREEWQSKHPQHETPRILRGIRLIATGWAARGSGFAADVTPENFRTFHENLAKARELFEPLAKEDDPADKVLEELAGLNTAESKERAETETLVRKMMKVSPRSIQFHRSVANGFLRRWGGGPQETQNYLRQVCDAVGGSDGDALYAIMATGFERYVREENGGQEGLDAPRCIRGWKHLVTQNPYDTYAMNYGLRLSYRLSDAASLGYFADWLALHEDRREPSVWSGFKTPELAFLEALRKARSQ